MDRVEHGELIYANPLRSAADVAGFRVEGDAALSFPRGRLRLESTRDAAEEQAANIVLWCLEDLPADLVISWDFWPIREPGLAILFFAATGRGGEDVFDPHLAERTGPYEQYHHGDINAYHVSYFRRRYPTEIRFQTCNLRKSYGFHLVAQGGDPIPSVAQADPPYRVSVTKHDGNLAFSVDGLQLLRWTDTGTIGGPVLGSGKIGFRQMAPMVAEYANLEVHEAVERGE